MQPTMPRICARMTVVQSFRHVRYLGKYIKFGRVSEAPGTNDAAMRSAICTACARSPIGMAFGY